MQTGTYISAAGHGVLIVSMLVSGWLGAEPPPFDVTEVSLISSEDFAALTLPNAAPEALTDVTPAGMPVPPTPRPESRPAEVASSDEALDDPEAPPSIETELAEDIPDIPAPPGPPVQDVAALAPPSDTPAPRDAPRVAPLPKPKTDAPEAPVISDAPPIRVSPESETPDVAEKASDAAAPEATTEIVTEAETPASSPRTSPHPSARPVRQADEAPEAPATDEIANAVAAAVADVLREADAPVGPPLSGSEKDEFVIAVQECWNVDPGSEAARVTVDIGFNMNRDGTIIVPSIRLLAATEGSDAVVNSAYEAGRRAIVRCGTKGYPLPPEKYDHWREVVVTFNPERMRLK